MAIHIAAATSIGKAAIRGLFEDRIGFLVVTSDEFSNMRMGLMRIITGMDQRPKELQDAGAYKVCLFLQLSAYLITELLCKERDETGDIHL